MFMSLVRSVLAPFVAMPRSQLLKGCEGLKQFSVLSSVAMFGGVLRRVMLRWASFGQSSPGPFSCHYISHHQTMRLSLKHFC